ncbi:hypothetical protein ABUV18_02269 [Clavibacter nebraskensis]
MDARMPGSGDGLTALPLDALRQLVYAQGADENDERWIRAAAELTRRERASSPAEGDSPAPASRRAPRPRSSPADRPADQPSSSSLSSIQRLSSSSTSASMARTPSLSLPSPS